MKKRKRKGATVYLILRKKIMISNLILYRTLNRIIYLAMYNSPNIKTSSHNLIKLEEKFIF